MFVQCNLTRRAHPPLSSYLQAEQAQGQCDAARGAGSHDRGEGGLTGSTVPWRADRVIWRKGMRLTCTSASELGKKEIPLLFQAISSYSYSESHYSTPLNG